MIKWIGNFLMAFALGFVILMCLCLAMWGAGSMFIYMEASWGGWGVAITISFIASLVLGLVHASDQL